MAESCCNVPEKTTFWFLGIPNKIWTTLQKSNSLVFVFNNWKTKSCCNIPENTIAQVLNSIDQLQDDNMDLYKLWTGNKAHFKCLIINTERAEVKNGREKNTWMKTTFQNPPLQKAGYPTTEQSFPYSSLTLKSQKHASSFFQHKAHAKSWIIKLCRKCEIAVIFFELKYFYLSNFYTKNICP